MFNVGTACDFAKAKDKTKFEPNMMYVKNRLPIYEAEELLISL